MLGPNRPIYVISDLHLGGAPSAAGRGFRMMTQPSALAAFVDALTELPGAELVIAGDFVDFLAERVEVDERLEDPPDGDVWVPFRGDPAAAEAVFNRLAGRRGPDADGQVFDALARFCQKPGHVLTLLLGNHDLELCLPSVRAALRRRLGAQVELLADNEALRRGPLIIEHGNRYDRFNQVDHDALRRVRSHLSRGLPPAAAPSFTPPAGSRLVAAVMNPIKSVWPFVDLLKPETAAVVPTLLALDPSRRDHMADVVRLVGPALARGVGPASTGFHHAPISALDDDPTVSFHDPISALDDDPLEALLAVSLKGADAAQVSAQISALDDISTVRGWLALLSPGPGVSERRAMALWRALRAAWRDESFSRDIETDAATIEAATFLRDAGSSVVVFGHSHLPKDVHLDGGGRYLNSGTWADRIRLPSDVFAPDATTGVAAVTRFLDDLSAGRTEGHVIFEPTYVRVEWTDTSIESAELRVWNGSL